MPFKMNEKSAAFLEEWNFTDFTDVFKQCAIVFNRSMASLFANTGGRVSSSRLIEQPAWAPLSPKYKEWKSKRVPFGTLVFSGELAASFSESGAPYHIEKIGKKEAVYGSSHPLAKFHQYGTRKMPQRQIIFDSDFRNNAFRRIFADNLVARFEARGIKIKL